MLLWTVKVATISFLLIFLVHHIFNFLKTTLTVPKEKDLVDQNKNNYENIIKVLETGHVPEFNILPFPDEIFVPPVIQSAEDMKNELKSFLRQQMKSSNIDNTSTSLDSLPLS